MIGPHINRHHRTKIGESIRQTKIHATERNFEWGAYQIFLAGPRSFIWGITMADERLLIESGMPGVAHSTYIDAPWNNRATRNAAIAHIQKELRYCRKIGLRGLVNHLVSAPVEYLRERATSILPDPDTISQSEIPTILYLENPHVKPINGDPSSRPCYATPAQLLELTQSLDEINTNPCYVYGLCVDTAHLWACGVDLTSQEAATTWLEGFQALPQIWRDRTIFHLNDSEKPRGAGVDKHAALGQGVIWGEDQSGLMVFLDYIRQNQMIAILERHSLLEIDSDLVFLRDRQ
jgi:endonuclease IV